MDKIIHLLLALLTAFFAFLTQPSIIEAKDAAPEFIGMLDSGDVKLVRPEGVALDSNGFIYVAHRGDEILKFSADHKYLVKFGSRGYGDGQFDLPAAVAVDKYNWVYVADYGNDRIQKFTSYGAFVTHWGSGGEELGLGDGELYGPSDIAMDAANNIYVADSTNNRIQKFSATGKFMAKWGSHGSGNGQFNHPQGIAVDSSGNVYVTDKLNHRVQKFTGSGQFITAWGSQGTGDGQFLNPFGIAVDSSGNVYVSSQHRVQKFTGTGTFLVSWGSLGKGRGQFNNPAGIDIDSAGNVYVADSYNDRVQIFGSKLLPSATINLGDRCCFTKFILGEAGQNKLHALRSFRDQVLMKNRLGINITRLYYEASPLVVALVSDHEAACWLARWLLVEPAAWAAISAEPLWHR